MNNINEVDPMLFEGLTSLKQINLSCNELDSIKSDLFGGLVNLEFLNLSSNSITSISTTLFESKKIENVSHNIKVL